MSIDLHIRDHHTGGNDQKAADDYDCIHAATPQRHVRAGGTCNGLSPPLSAAQKPGWLIAPGRSDRAADLVAVSRQPNVTEGPPSPLWQRALKRDTAFMLRNEDVVGEQVPGNVVPKLLPSFLRRVLGNAGAGQTRVKRRNPMPSSEDEYADHALKRILDWLFAFVVGVPLALVAIAAMIFL